MWMGLWLLYIGAVAIVFAFTMFTVSVGYVGVTREFKQYPVAKLIIPPLCAGLISLVAWLAFSFCHTQYEWQVSKDRADQAWDKLEKRLENNK